MSRAEKIKWKEEHRFKFASQLPEVWSNPTPIVVETYKSSSDDVHRDAAIITAERTAVTSQYEKGPATFVADPAML
jgi:hypothetical protein